MQLETTRPDTDLGTALTKYSIDVTRSRFTLQAFAGGMLSAMGHNPTFTIRNFSGEIQFHLDSLDQSSLTLNIDPASIELSGIANDKDSAEIMRRMRDEVLEVDRFPAIEYQCDHASGNASGNQFQVTLNGNLILHGITQQQPVNAYVNLSEDSLRANGTFSIKQTEYEIELVSALGGAIRVKDEVKFSFDIMARRE